MMGTIDTFTGRAEPAPARPSARTAIAAAWSGLGHRFRLVAERWRQRRDLSELTDHQLRDIGVTREEGRREAARRFWD
jgi:uncharacterized protein YjiS (DUF1127 family)